MMMLNFVFNIIFIASLFGNIKTSIIDPEQFGLYAAIFEKFETCRGPRAHDVTSNTVNLADDEVAHFNITFLQNTQLKEIKFFVSTGKNGSRTALPTNRVKNPCDHFMMGPSIAMFLRPANKCTIKKGSYYFKVNLADATYAFLGKNFFYNDYLVKIMATSSKENIICFVTNIKFVKKPANT